VKHIDLHGLTHIEAEKAIDSLLNECMIHAYRKKRSMESVKVITGNSEAMKNVVKKVAKELQLNVTDLGFAELTIDDFLY
jgi:DNA-nicking Smr family endonuclease